MYSVINDGTAVSHSHNTGDYGSFYGEVKPMELDYIHNLHASEDKTFDNLTFKTKSFNGNTIKPLDTWDKVSVSTDLRATGDLVIRTKDTFPAPYTQGEVWASYVKNKYMLSIPGNAVVDEFLNITDPSNIDQSILYKSRIKGDAMKVSLRYLNSDNYKFMVNFMACTVRLNAR